MANITARKLTDSAQRGQWMTYTDSISTIDGTNVTPVLVRKTKALALRDAHYYMNPIKCCGRLIRSFDRIEFTDTHVSVRCLCCGETTKQAFTAPVEDLTFAAHVRRVFGDPESGVRHRKPVKVQRCTTCNLTSYDGDPCCPECGQAYV